MCAIAARPETPGHHETGDPAAGAKADAVQRETSWQAGLWDPEWKIRPEWGPCPIDNVRFEELHFSPDGRYARTLGGWQGAPLAGAWGYCLFEKKGRSWDLLRCAITAVS